MTEISFLNMPEKIKNLPDHVAIIPDGNRRWAKKRALWPWLGHQQGAKSFEKVLDRLLELKVPYVTFWGGSWDNLTKRSGAEVKFLLKIYDEQFKRIIKDERTHKNQVRVKVLGRWREVLPPALQKTIAEAMEATKNYNKYFFTFLLAYDGTDEMIQCFQQILDKGREKSIKITKETIKASLWTKDLPPVDLIIRTGCEGDPHLSAGFMMWDTAYSQLYFTETLFPDFGPKELDKALLDFSQRARRFGK